MANENQPTTAEDWEKIAEKILLGQHVLTEVLEFVNHKRVQKGQTPEQILAHAKTTNARAGELINNL